ncbi:hypothetical protein HMPREF2692_01395 [Corynebacterium sp. HMSC036D03]|uniref:hypothetical protein n=1 Tax=Corynebacterium sp. HMSC036D03 TaxID=1715171 RepID=UPI0008AA33AA|nr:hypothetical protein [Corynebacterium sp. HMSC036D03]OHO71197.1 hypothetical protein HMPREF2692_01395 [Corynebacterium sp. HMSC036D03]
MTRTLQLLIGALTFQLFSRGLDYVLGNPQQGVGAFRISEASPSLVWGAACIIAALIVAAGLLRQCPRVVRAGAILAAAIYGAFAVMVFDDVYVQGPIDDWRFFTGYLATAFMWAVIAWSLTIRIAVIKNREVTRDTNGDS